MAVGRVMGLAAWLMPPLELSCTRSTCPAANEMASLVGKVLDSTAMPEGGPHGKLRGVPTGLDRPLLDVYVSRTRLLEPPLEVRMNTSSVPLPHPLQAKTTGPATTRFVTEAVIKAVQSPSAAELLSKA
jgi:hypothetical protein